MHVLSFECTLFYLSDTAYYVSLKAFAMHVINRLFSDYQLFICRSKSYDLDTCSVPIVEVDVVKNCRLLRLHTEQVSDTLNFDQTLSRIIA